MAVTWQFYADAGLTVPLTTLSAQQSSAGGAVDLLIYFGSTASGKSLQASSSPGVDPIQITPTDADGAGTNLAATAIKLALSAGGLTSATGGAALTVGTTLTSGTAGAVPVYVRLDSGTSTLGTYTDLSLDTNALIES
jgi:hypothetical protein